MTGSYEVRIATIDDVARVTALLQASYPALMASAYDPAALAAALPLMTKANEKLLASGTYYVAEAADGALIGCGGWTRERPGTAGVEPGLGHIRHFATHPAWTGRGIGRALLTRCEADALSASIEVLECYSSLNAVAFYTALGFETLGSLDIDLEGKARLPSVLMRKRIAEPRAGKQVAFDGNSRTQPGTDRREPRSQGGENVLNGNCLCGAVRYTAGNEILSATICHCTLCRRASGAPFVAWLTVPAAEFRFVAGTPARYASSEHGTRTFCGTCGSPLTFQSARYPDEVDVTICTLEQPEAVAPEDHTFVRSMLPWVGLADGLPRYGTSREDED